MSLLLPDEVIREFEHCNKCGFCLPACPTYQETGLEMHSPRGRLSLVEAAWRGELAPGAGLWQALSWCIGCRACESACPSGVQYGVVLTHARRDLRRQSRRYVIQNRVTVPLLFLVTRRTWLRAALRAGRVVRTLPLPTGLKRTVALLPAEAGAAGPAEPQAPSPTGGVPVYLLGTCVMEAAYPEANRDARWLLAAAGARVLPQDTLEGCCGALHLHTGDYEGALDLARAAVRRFDATLPQESLIVTHAGGCGAMIREYARLLRDDAELASRAAHWASRVHDFATVLTSLPNRLRFRGDGATVALQNSCHLIHGMQEGVQPTALLSTVTGDRFVTLPGQDRCCGSGGVYNLNQPAMAARVLKPHLDEVRQQGVDIWIMNNPGCALQCERGVREAGLSARVMHLSSYLRERLLTVTE